MPRKAAPVEPPLPVVYYDWAEACKIDFDDIGYYPGMEEEMSGKLSGDEEDDDSIEDLVHIPAKPPPKVTDLSSVDIQIREYIDQCVSSGEDPVAKHRFYLKVEDLLNEAQDKGLVNGGEDEVNSLWAKYDQWAVNTLESLNKQDIEEQAALVNDLKKFAPEPPGTTPFNKRKCSFRYRTPSKWGRRGGNKKNKRSIINSKIGLANRTLYEFLSRAAETGTPPRNDPALRREFFDQFPHFCDEMHEPFMDFYWNALLHRSLDYYKRAEEHLQMKAMAKKKAKSKSSSSTATVATAPPPKRPKSSIPFRILDLNRLVKRAINDCIRQGKEPRASHSFYWTCYLAIAASKIEFGFQSKKTRDYYWNLWDGWAAEAWEKREPLQLEAIVEDTVYQDVTHLPVEKTTGFCTYPAPGGSLIVEIKMAKLRTVEEFKQVLARNVRYIVTTAERVNDRATVFRTIPVRDNLFTRRSFLETYAGHCPVNVEASVVDEFWRKLLTETREDYAGKEMESCSEQESEEDEEGEEVGSEMMEGNTVIKVEVEENSEEEDVEDEELDQVDNSVEIKREVDNE